METELRTRVKPWGNSLGIVIPKEFLIRSDIKSDDEVNVTITKEKTLKRLFGKGRKVKIDSQKMKNESRKIWEA